MAFNLVLIVAFAVLLCSHYVLALVIFCEESIFFASQYFAFFKREQWEIYKKLKSDPSLYEVFHWGQIISGERPYYIVTGCGLPHCSARDASNPFMSKTAITGLHGGHLLLDGLVSIKKNADKKTTA